MVLPSLPTRPSNFLFVGILVRHASRSDDRPRGRGGGVGMSFTWRATSRIISAAVASSTCDGWRAARQNRRSQSIIISTTGAVTEIIRHLLHIAAEGVLTPRLLLYEFHLAAVIDRYYTKARRR
jgi:hypothetical protein